MDLHNVAPATISDLIYPSLDEVFPRVLEHFFKHVKRRGLV